MIPQHHIHTLNTANQALQKAWERVLQARQGKDPIALQNAVMAYCQALQRVNVMAETAITAR